MNHFVQILSTMAQTSVAAEQASARRLDIAWPFSGVAV